MNNARLCRYDSRIKCWVEKGTNSRWLPKRDYSGKVGAVHFVYTEAKHNGYMAIYPHPDSIPTFISENMNPDNLLYANDLIWGHVFSKTDKKVLSHDITEVFWVPANDLEAIPFTMTFDINVPENRRIRDEVNLILTHLNVFTRLDDGVKITLDSITLTGLPDQFGTLFANLMCIGEMEDCSQLETKFQAGYDNWIRSGYSD